MRKPLARTLVASLLLFCVIETVMPSVADAHGGQRRRRGATTARRVRARRVPTVAPAAPSGPRTVVIDISDQRLYQYENGALVGNLPVSTGNDRPFKVRGRRYVGRTPRGNFSIGRKIVGVRYSSLAIGRMYYPSYFVGGFAIHGGRLPGYPASHGCVRIPMGQAVSFFNWAVRGTGVTVRD